MTEGSGNSSALKSSAVSSQVECARSLPIYLAVGQSPGQVAHHVPIPPHITEATTHCAEPFYFCLVIQDRRPHHSGWGKTPPPTPNSSDEPTEVTGSCAAAAFKGTLDVGLKPHDPYGGELPVVADLT